MNRHAITNRLLKQIFRAKGDFAGSPPLPVKADQQVELAPFYDNALAAVSFSADFELNWAWRGRDSMEQRGCQGRNNVPRLVQMLESFGIPVTWATVGHLFLESCNRHVDGRGHPDMPRPLRNDRWEGDWYKHDPCTDYRRDPLWYAPDLLEQIKSGTVAHEIGTHTFSHISLAPEHAEDKLVRAELEASIRAMEGHGLRPRTLVYPYNVMGHHHHQLLALLGITVVRNRDRRHRFAYPQRLSSGLYLVDETMNLRIARHYDYLRKVAIFLAEAKKRRTAFHLWFHPSDSWAVFSQVLRGILEIVSEERDSERIWVTTMAQLVAFCEARHQTQLRVVRSKERIDVELWGSYDAERYGQTSLTLLVRDLPPSQPISVEVSDGRQVEYVPARFRRGEMGLWFNFKPGIRRARLNLANGM